MYKGMKKNIRYIFAQDYRSSSTYLGGIGPGFFRQGTGNTGKTRVE